MINISKLVDYLLLNAYSVNSSGLYNGKAGISLCLFEMSRFLQDEYIEEQAFELLKESLLTKNEDIGFENGLSGIGYVLLYLIQNKFIEADFEDLFGHHQKRIEEYIGRLNTTEINKENFVRHNLKIIFFLDLLLSHGNKYQQMAELHVLFSDTANQLLRKYASVIENRQNISLKPEYITLFEIYLKASNVCRNFQSSSDTIKTYSRLFSKNKFVSNFIIGYYLENIAAYNNDIQLKDTAGVNRTLALKNLYPETMSLTQRIEFLYLLRQDEDLYKKPIELLEKDLFHNIRQSDFERNLSFAIGTNCFITGYQSGIARFLLYWVFCNLDKNIRKRIAFL